ncbi:MAG TPA: hypothetical protein VE289_01540 [Gaiellaceae bacterium]|nr:hypothetical protein [Gaiellaceae bacterium]
MKHVCAFFTNAPCHCRLVRRAARLSSEEGIRARRSRELVSLAATTIPRPRYLYR